MNKAVLRWTLCFILSLFSVAFAAEPDAAALAKMKRYAALRPLILSTPPGSGMTLTTSDAMRNVDASIQLMLHEFSKDPNWNESNPDWQRLKGVMEADSKEILDKVRGSGLSKNTEHALKVLQRSMASRLTRAELDEMIAFYSSPAGRALAGLQEDMMRDMPAAISRVMVRMKQRPGAKPQMPDNRAEFALLGDFFREWVILCSAVTTNEAGKSHSGQAAIPVVAAVVLMENYPTYSARWNRIPEADRQRIVEWRSSALGQKELTVLGEAGKDMKPEMKVQESTAKVTAIVTPYFQKWRLMAASMQQKPSAPTPLAPVAPVVPKPVVMTPDYVPLDQIEIPAQFETIAVTRESYGTEVNKCMPPFQAQSKHLDEDIAKFPNRNTVAYGHRHSASRFVLRESTGICLKYSAAKYPIFAAEAMIETVNPKGVPPDVTGDWYRQIALQLARKGTAKVAYHFDNGNAFVVDYWIDREHGFQLQYASQFRKAGTWEADRHDLRFTHPAMSSVQEMKRGSRMAKPYPLMHRRP